MNIITKLIYRPPENHVGVIYRCGRFKRLIDPDQRAFLIPLIDEVKKETRLDMRTTHVQLEDVYTRYNIAINIEMKIFYYVDLRKVAPARLLQVLRFPVDNAWDEIVRTAINDITRNMICIAKSFDEFNSEAGRRYLKTALSGDLAQRVKGFGIIVDSRYGVNIVNLQPNEEFRKALMDESAARALGSAAVSRLSPLMDKLMDKNQEQAIATVLMEIASALVKSGEVPDIIFPNSSDYPTGGITRGDGQGSIMPNIPGFSQSQRKPKSLAGD